MVSYTKIYIIEIDDGLMLVSNAISLERDFRYHHGEFHLITRVLASCLVLKK